MGDADFEKALMNFCSEIGIKNHPKNRDLKRSNMSNEKIETIGAKREIAIV